MRRLPQLSGASIARPMGTDRVRDTALVHPLLACAAILAVAHCTPPTPAPRAAPIAAGGTSNAATVPDAGPRDKDAAAVLANDAGPVDAAASAIGSNAERFRCGLSSCRVGPETCCLTGADGVCVASAPDSAPQGQVGYLLAQFEACSAAVAPGGYSLSGIERCDESIDCAAGRVCCDQFLFSGSTLSECVPLSKSGATPCEFGERCIESASCRLPGTLCVEGFCRKPVAKLDCDGAVCLEGRVCCGDLGACRAAEACPSRNRVHCTSDAHCVKGERCVVHGVGSDCIAVVQDALSQQRVCRHEGDCARIRCSESGSRARCRTSAVPWLRSCQCAQ